MVRIRKRRVPVYDSDLAGSPGLFSRSGIEAVPVGLNLLKLNKSIQLNKNLKILPTDINFVEIYNVLAICRGRNPHL
jgi:hypothetical protein